MQVQQVNSGQDVVENKALTSAGAADYKSVVVERALKTNTSGQATSEALSRNATLATANGFSLGVTDAAVMAGIHEALSKLVDVDVTRRKLNRELTFMEADTIASKMTLAAEKERQGAALTLGMSIGGAFASIAAPVAIDSLRKASQTKLKQGEELGKLYEKKNDYLMEPVNKAKNSTGGQTSPELWDPKSSKHPRSIKDESYRDGAGNLVEKGDLVRSDGSLVAKKDDVAGVAQAENAHKARMENPDNWLEKAPRYKHEVGVVDAQGAPVMDPNDPTKQKTQEFTLSAKEEFEFRREDVDRSIRPVEKDGKQEYGYFKTELAVRDTPGSKPYIKTTELEKAGVAQELGPEFSKVDAAQYHESLRGSNGMVKRADKDLLIRGNASGFNMKSGEPTSTPTSVDGEALRKHEIEQSASGYTDKSLTDQLKELSSADQRLTAYLNIAQVPGQLLTNAGGAISDLTFNKEAKELEASATRDSATQSFFSDNAGTLGGEIQGALQGIDAVKGFIEVGSAIAGGIRA
jgi:hypothetical protein